MPRTLTASERAFITQMPKAELHVHLEGSVHPETLLDLGRKYGISYPFSDMAGAQEWFRFRDFPHFIEVYIAIKQVLRTSEDYARIAREIAADAAQQHIRYLEITFAPGAPSSPPPATSGDTILAGLRAGAKTAREDYGVQLQFICDPVRARPVDEVLGITRWTVDNLGDGLVGLGFGGAEVDNPPAPYREAFALAKAGGARLVLHAGETVGPESVWAALAVGSERIGHGVRSIEDPALVAELAARQIVLEVSPTSNIRLGVYPDYAAHPFRTLHEAGVPLTVNSDDPPMFNTTLTNEYVVLAEQFDFTIDDLVNFSLRAVDAAFLPAPERAAMAAQFQAEFAALRHQHQLG